MTIDVILHAAAVTTGRVLHRSVAVMDVFRATSVIVESLQNGARAVIPVVTVEQALDMVPKFGRQNVVLGGERGTRLISGFDKDNSPLAYTADQVRGKVIIQTTTNGTRAIYNCRSASEIYISSFLNMTAVCRAMAASGRDLVLVCAGREDNFTAEDGLCAGAMADFLERSYNAELSDIAQVMRDMYRTTEPDLKGRLSGTAHYRYMVSQKYFDDIDFCLQKDIYDIAPRYNAKGEVTL